MTPFRYQSREGGGIITIYAATQDEADELRRRGYEVEAKKITTI